LLIEVYNVSATGRNGVCMWYTNAWSLFVFYSYFTVLQT